MEGLGFSVSSTVGQLVSGGHGGVSACAAAARPGRCGVAQRALGVSRAVRLCAYCGRMACVAAHAERARGPAGFALRMAKEDQEAAREAAEEVGEEDKVDEGGQEEDASSVGEEDVADGVDALLNSPEFLRKKLEVLQKELAEERAATEKMEAALKNEKESYLRLAADFENFRRRTAADLTDSGNRATVTVLKSLLTVLDNFELAETALAPKTEGEESIMKSYKALNKQLLDVLVKLKVEPVEAVGVEFDPNVMEAITQQPSDEYEEGIVSAQMKRGYKLGDLVVRPAMVVVSMGKQ
ncbi:Protein GrpE [Porphyridium purpureum]|uniref:GrpE protein homolog n=1 Tax=Porphyridium purpureum TaxID=35688 RepID=A0A5J4YHA7_PORPP|nr:Protein GrpE [Porphyridium purpureum]|eukprot:POR9309..scf251_18